LLEPTNLLLLACALIYGLIGEPVGLQDLADPLRADASAAIATAHAAGVRVAW
jgi:hypothetical protein